MRRLRRTSTSTPLRPVQATSTVGERLETESYRNVAILATFLKSKAERTLRKLKDNSAEKFNHLANCTIIVQEDSLNLCKRRDELQNLLQQTDQLQAQVDSLDKLECLAKQTQQLSTDLSKAITSRDGTIVIKKQIHEDIAEIQKLIEESSKNLTGDPADREKVQILAETSKSFVELSRATSDLSSNFNKQIDEKMAEVKQLLSEYETNAALLEMLKND